MKDITFIFDFDSTFVKSEGLEELAEICLETNPQKDKILSELKELTIKGMSGEISFSESLYQRLSLFKPTKDNLTTLVERLREDVTPSFTRNKQFFSEYRDQIYIVSGGFKEWIVPVVEEFGIHESHVLANEFVFNENGIMIDIDKENPLAKDLGKPKVIEDLGLTGKIFIIGDGYTDYQIKAKGVAKNFFVFTENLKRNEVVNLADYILPDLDEFLYIYDLPRTYSYPKSRIKVLVDNSVSQENISKFASEGFSINLIQNLEEFKETVFNRTQILWLDCRSYPLLEQEILNKKSRLKVLICEDIRCLSEELINLLNSKGIMILADTEDIDKTFFAEDAINFINKGDTLRSFNYPKMKLKKTIETHRFIHLHKNQPGELAKLNSVMASYNLNIEAQLLQTKGNFGYVITDINKEYDEEVIIKLRSIPGTVKMRVLF